MKKELDENNTPITNIVFFNPNTGYGDETQFDTDDEKELAELWWYFCKENGLIDLR